MNNDVLGYCTKTLFYIVQNSILLQTSRLFETIFVLGIYRQVMILILSFSLENSCK